MDEDRLSLLGSPLPPAFARRVVWLPPGFELPYDPADWRDSLVVVERGELELQGICGNRRTLRAGSILWMTGLRLRMLRNPGPEPTLLAAVSRRSVTGQDQPPMSFPPDDRHIP
jgi:hypothetical protein